MLVISDEVIQVLRQDDVTPLVEAWFVGQETELLPRNYNADSGGADARRMVRNPLIMRQIANAVRSTWKR